jgi:SAM-dependent methyltransferase
MVAMIEGGDAAIALDHARMQRVLADRHRRVAAAQVADPMLSEHIHAVLMEELSGAHGLVRQPGGGAGGDGCGTPIGALLDVGTGCGHMLKLLAPHARRAVGIDISSDALRMARTNIHGTGLSHCELRRGDMYDLPFAAEQFDVVTVGRMLACAEVPLKAVREFSRVLKRGGRLLILDDFDALEAAGKSNPISMLREWFAAAGLQFERAHPLDTEHGHLLIALARRTLLASVAA